MPFARLLQCRAKRKKDSSLIQFVMKSVPISPIALLLYTVMVAYCGWEIGQWYGGRAFERAGLHQAIGYTCVPLPSQSVIDGLATIDSEGRTVRNGKPEMTKGAKP